ncbi:THUMP domain-containing protein 1-like [Polyodon spathula]|uniref:THUMP domain-containing protein 1-like n=1 Tax=Polyodon spathula TaxID=7913 RepID=UPI001B7DC29F|nr:THUMP domain-containing protein 1-like [Polyodon spathula]XP_041098516.1 THUMP domain-containing protein 1-like [Polyodon spathula]
MAAVQESKKRSRKQYTNYAAKKQRGCGARELEVGMQGILLTCNMNQSKCTAEAYSLLNEYADKLYGPEKVRCPHGALASLKLRERKATAHQWRRGV